MLKINWETLSDDALAIEILKKIPIYKNNALKTAYWRFRFFLSLVQCRLFNITKPLFVVLVTNNNCNLNCTYCYGEYGEKGTENNYSTRKLLRIIDELKALGSKILTMHGGEALLRKDFGLILNYAKNLGFYVSVNTNGYLVEKKINDLKCADTVVISLDGEKSNNDAYRGEGCYDKAIEAIKILNLNKIPVIISSTLTDLTSNDTEFLAHLAKENKSRVQFSILYNDYNLTKKNGERISGDKSIRYTVEIIKDLVRRNFPIYYSNEVLDATLHWGDDFDLKREITIDDLVYKGIDKKKHKNLIPCYHGTLKVQIDGDGRAIRCWATNKESAPNINVLGVENALSHLALDNACKHCAYLANNEHNSLMHLSFNSVLHIAKIQISDIFKTGFNNKKSINKNIIVETPSQDIPITFVKKKNSSTKIKEIGCKQ